MKFLEKSCLLLWYVPRMLLGNLFNLNLFHPSGLCERYRGQAYFVERVDVFAESSTEVFNRRRIAVDVSTRHRCSEG